MSHAASHEALARFVEDLGEFLEPDRCVDVVTQHRLAGIYITDEQAFDPISQQGLAKRRISLGARLNGVPKIFRHSPSTRRLPFWKAGNQISRRH